VSGGVYRSTLRSTGEQYPPPLWIIPNWIDPDEFCLPSPAERGKIREALGLQEHDLVLAFVGRHWIKGAQVIERAIAALPLEDQRVVLLSAGEQRNERRRVAAGREVWNLGLVQPTEMRRIYCAADIGVVPSVTEETAPLAALEMMACGLPVIASRVGGLPELIEDGITGHLVDLPNAVDSWVEVVAELLCDPETRSKMSQAARTSVVKRFHPQRALEDWTRVISAIDGSA
jgi:L-malate glycosyltransferase